MATLSSSILASLPIPPNREAPTSQRLLHESLCRHAVRLLRRPPSDKKGHARFNLRHPTRDKVPRCTHELLETLIPTVVSAKQGVVAAACGCDLLRIRSFRLSSPKISWNRHREVRCDHSNFGCVSLGHRRSFLYTVPRVLAFDPGHVLTHGLQDWCVDSQLRECLA